ncbi:MAG: DUF721 domain-containing protein [Candidatus Amulumruptor caecigallinarius]|nr:DUF721 domain-containing protein [Candidatus Amulumruptor caecigallinarius]
MDRKKPEQLGDVLRSVLEEQGVSERLKEVRAALLWPAIVGEDIAGQTSRPIVNVGVMTIKVYSASLRHELAMSRSVLKRLLNEAVGEDVISDIRFH